MKKLTKWETAVLSAAGFLLLGKLVFALLPYPELKKFMERAYSTRIYERNGYLISVVPLENGLRREFTPLKEIPSSVKKSFIKAEDRRFYFHWGIDFISLGRALLQNHSAERNVSGASTISMQLARIISPSPERNFRAKLKDALNAMKLEARLSKSQILELYLNNVPFGRNSEGVTSSARTYFGCELNGLSQEKAAMLSVIPRNPAFYDPFYHPEELQKAVLRINHSFSDTVLQTASREAQSFSYPDFFPHYTRFLTKRFPEVFAKNYEIQLFCDLKLQLFAENQLKNALENSRESRISNGAVLVCDSSTGGILCWVGSNSFYDEINGQIDGVTNKIQPGSSMKPFLYALAFDTEKDGQKLLYPSKVLEDIPVEFGDKKLYIPQNFNNKYNGPVLTRVALASSLNIPAVSLLNETGIENYAAILSDMKFSGIEKEAEKADLSLSLGGGEVSLFELVPAFQTFPRDGNFHPVENFLYLSDRKQMKKLLKSRKSALRKIYSTDTSRILCAFLSDKSARSLGFGYEQTFETDYPAIFKTGTSNQYQNITALGATKNYGCGVWMGNFNGNTVIGKTGSSLPASVAKAVLDYLEKENYGKDSSREFPEPENYHLEKVCSLSGLKPSSFCRDSVYEYIQNGTENEECTWHCADGKITYPAEFQEWILAYGKNGTINYASSELKIKTPVNGSVFIKDPEQTIIKQIIPVEVFGGNGEKLKVYLDGKFIKDLERPFSFQLEPSQGNHELSVECGNEKTSVDFSVE